MTDSVMANPLPPDGRSAGQLLREARLRQGLDASTLAGLMKVPIAKIEAIEADRAEALPGVAFTRSLALAICRTLKTDPQPVLDRLPRTDGHTLDEVSRGINAPFRDPRGGVGALDLSLLRRPIVWGPLVFAVGVGLLWWLPVVPFGDRAADLVSRLPGTASVSASSPAPSGVESSVPAAPSVMVLPPESTRVDVLHASPPMAPTVAASGSAGAALPATTAPEGSSTGPDAAAAGSAALLLRSSGTSWVEVRDARGAVLLSRTLQPGESVGLTGALPMQAVVGNASQTTALVRGQSLDITPFTRDNVARFEVR